MRHRRTGKQALEHRLSMLRQPNECWHFHSSKVDGYGQVWVDGKRWIAHRLAWVVWRGPIPAGFDVLHACDVRDCVNPDHLFLGNDIINQRDCRAKGRLARAKITQKIADEIRSLRNTGWRPTDIARRFGVSVDNVSHVTRGRNWC